MTLNESTVWAKKYKEHGSTAQYSIWHCIMMLAKFEEVKVDIDGFDSKDIIHGEKDFYTFMKTLYGDMYANPEQYGIPAAEYDEYMKNIDINKIHANGHKGDAKEAKLRRKFQQAIQFYPNYFWELGLAADEICNSNYELVISKSKYENVLKSFDNLHIKNESGQWLNALNSNGITINENSKKCYITCKKAPKMFLGLKVLLTAPESKYKTENKFRKLNYLRLDYKSYYRPIPGIEDIKMTLKEDHRGILTLLLSQFDNFKTRFALAPRSNITSGDDWKVDYFLTNNNKRIFGFSAGPDFLKISFGFKSPENLMRIIETLEKNDQKLFEWFRDNFTEVFHLDCPRNRAVMFGNQEKHICGGGSMEIANPDKSDIKKCLALIKLIEN